MRNFCYVFLAFTCAFLASPLAADDVPPNPKVEVTYVKPERREFQPIYDRFKERKVLERLARFLYPLNLPAKFKVSTAECGGIFKPFNRRNGVVLCYEVIASIRSAARRATIDNPSEYQTAVMGGVTQALLYRTAIGLIDVLNIPVWGRYTDAADKLAAIVMLRFGPSAVADISIKGAVAYFKASEKVWSGADFGEIRSPTIQRYFNYACLAFGSDPVTFKHFKDEFGILKRAGFIDKPDVMSDDLNWCKFEFEDARTDFVKAMGPHIDQEKLGKLANFTIFEAGDFQ